MLVTDDQRYDTIAALGNPHISKPNMDGLAARGMSFTYVYIPGGTVARCVCLAGQCYIQVAICLVYKNAAQRAVRAQYCWGTSCGRPDISASKPENGTTDR